MTFNFVSYARLHKDIREFCAKLPDFDAIIGIPRSGTFIANLIALQKNTRFGLLYERQFIILQGGLRDNAKDVKRVLVFDDSVSTGTSMTKVKETLETVNGGSLFYKDMRIEYGCLYVEPDTEKYVDHYLRVISNPRMFEWNFMNHGLLERACCDIDGILCNDYKDGEDIEKQEETHIQNAVCINKPKYRIHSIVSGRIQKFSDATFRWLLKNEIPCDNLYLRPDRNESAEDFKARIYKDNPCIIFIESSEYQAKIIAEKSGKPVLCIDTMTVYGNT